MRLLKALGHKTIHGLCWASKSGLAAGPKARKNTAAGLRGYGPRRPMAERNVQMYLRDLERVGLIFPYDVGPHRANAYIVFESGSPIPAWLCQRLWAAVDPKFAKRMGRQVEQDADHAAESAEEVAELLASIRKEQEDLTPSERHVFLRLRGLTASRRQRHRAAIPTLDQAQVLSRVQEQMYPRCWFTTSYLASGLEDDDIDFAESTVREALRGLEAKGWYCPYGDGPFRGLSYVLFKQPQPAELLQDLWAGATPAFVKRMARSPMADPPMGDPAIAIPSPLREIKEEQQARGAAADLNSFPSTPECATATAQLQPPASAPTEPPPSAPDPDALPTRKEGSSDIEQARTYLDEVERRLNAAEKLALDKIRKGLKAIAATELPIARYLQKHRGRPFIERLMFCVAQIESVRGRSQPPKRPDGYLTSALADNYAQVGTGQLQEAATRLSAVDPPPAAAAPVLPPPKASPPVMAAEEVTDWDQEDRPDVALLRRLVTAVGIHPTNVRLWIAPCQIRGDSQRVQLLPPSPFFSQRFEAEFHAQLNEAARALGVEYELLEPAPVPKPKPLLYGSSLEKSQAVEPEVEALH